MSVRQYLSRPGVLATSHPLGSRQTAAGRWLGNGWTKCVMLPRDQQQPFVR